MRSRAGIVWRKAVARTLTHCRECGGPILPSEPALYLAGMSKHPDCERERIVVDDS